MKIILDAMGGDLAPKAPVLGAVEANKMYGTEITLVGKGEEILEVLKGAGIDTLPVGMEIANADDVVDMHDDPAKVIHKRKNSSMVVGLRMLAEGQGDAFVSAGSTGALLTGATLIVKRVKGIRRAAMAPAMPVKTGGSALSATAVPMRSVPLNFCCSLAWWVPSMPRRPWVLPIPRLVC